ncbi:MAG TPA: hypothetical protein VLA99_14230 [Nitrospiraceae bacterium]|nr:hypothetical protein [Nitrospiraceae bacterium]
MNARLRFTKGVQQRNMKQRHQGAAPLSIRMLFSATRQSRYLHRPVIKMNKGGIADALAHPPSNNNVARRHIYSGTAAHCQSRERFPESPAHNHDSHLLYVRQSARREEA